MIASRFRFALLWMVVVLFLGSAQFGPQQTGQHVVPTLRTLAPWMAMAEVQTIHTLLRKLSHVTEYAVLALLWLRAFRSQVRFSLEGAAWAALAVCLACAIVDEVHQAYVPGRIGSVRDVALDSLGAVGMVMFVRARRPGTRADVSADGSPSKLPTVRLDEGG
jgi:VanZ family protein